MARVTAPLLSLEAKGQLGKAVIFQNFNLKSTVYKYHFPGSKTNFTPTDYQLVCRELYNDILKEWQNLPLVEKQYYNNLGNNRSKPITGFNLYLKKKFMSTIQQLMESFFLPRVSGLSYQPTIILPNSGTASILSKDYLYFMPWFDSLDITFDKLIIEITTGVLGAKYRCGIWDSDFKNVLLDFLNYFDGSLSGVKIHSLVSNMVLKKNVKYWFGFISDSAVGIRFNNSRTARHDFGGNSSGQSYSRAIQSWTFHPTNPLPSNIRPTIDLSGSPKFSVIAV